MRKSRIAAFAALLIAAALASCDSATGQIANTQLCQEKPKSASNVTVGNKSVSACFEQCDVQFTLNFSNSTVQDSVSETGSAVIELVGKEREMFPADVFQLQPNEWIADLGSGQYVKIFAESGFAQMDIGGKFSVFIPDAGTAFAEIKE